jgi:hypothetical protein
MPEWIKSLSPVEAAFMGSVIGSSVTFLVGILAAFLNASLNRRRDDRLRRNEMKTIVAGLRAELEVLRTTLLHHLEQLEDLSQKGTIINNFMVPDPASAVRIFPELTGKLGLLNEATISVVMRAFISIEEYVNRLILGGANPISNLPPGRLIVEVPGKNLNGLIRLNHGILEMIDEAILQLNATIEYRRFL